MTRGHPVEYVAERIRQDRAEQAEHDRLRAQFDAAGTLVTADLSDGAERLASLTHDGEPLTPEAHAGCPGRGVFFPSWNRTQPVHYCASPADYGHTSLYARPTPVTSTAQVNNPGAAPEPAGPGTAPEDPGRRLVIEGNRAWAAAAGVRKRWLAQLLARRAAPREVARFVTGQLLTMPEPLRLALSGAYAKPLFTELAGRPANLVVEGIETCPAVRLPLLMLAPIAAAYESEMSGADATRRATWRGDRYSPCPRRDAGHYLTFLASLGYPLTPIEQAVADGRPYTGDDPATPLISTGVGGGPDGDPVMSVTVTDGTSAISDVEAPAGSQPAEPDQAGSPNETGDAPDDNNDPTSRTAVIDDSAAA
jgi:hypothetical protein